MESAKFFTLGQLREITKDLPDEHELIFQVVSTDGKAWNCFADFCKNIISPDGNLSCITFSHPELKHLPELNK